MGKNASFLYGFVVGRIHSHLHGLYGCLICAGLAVLCSSSILPDSLVLSLPVVRAEANHSMHRMATSSTPLQIIHSDDIMRGGSIDLTSALSKMAGIQLHDYGGAGGMKTVSLRGMGSPHTGVSYNGIPMQDVQTGSVDLSMFNMGAVHELAVRIGENFQMLQCARSAASAGSVEIQSAPHSFETEQETTSNATQLQLSYGSFSRVGAHIKNTTQFKNGITMQNQASCLYSLNDYSYPVYNGTATTNEYRQNNRMNAFHLQSELGRNLRKNREKWNAMLYYYNNNHHLPGIVVLYNPYNNEKLHTQQAFGQGSWQKQWTDQWTLRVLGKYSWQESLYQDKKGSYPNGILQQNYWTREAYGSAVLHWGKEKQKTQLSYALDFIYNDINSNLGVVSNANRNTLLQALTIQHTEGKVRLNGRILATSYWNRNEVYQSAPNGLKLSPSLAANWQISREFSARLFYKDIFRMPTFTENYYYHLGNPDLKPENTHQLGLGGVFHRQRAGSLWRESLLTIDVYHNRITDKIVSIPVNLHVWRMLNIAKSQVWGLDFTSQNIFAIHPLHQLQLQTNISWQEALDCTSSARLQLPYIPCISGNATIVWKNPWLNMSVSIDGMSHRWGTSEHAPTTKLTGFTEENVSLWKEVALFSHSSQISLTLQNITNKHYMLINGYPMPGRNFLIKYNVHL